MYSIGDIMKTNKNSLLPIALFLLCALLICFSAQAKDGALLGFTLAQKVVIPSLLPLLILFNLVQEITSQKPAGKFSKRHRSFRPYRRLSRRRTAYRFALRR